MRPEPNLPAFWKTGRGSRCVAVGDAVPEGGRPGKPKARTGGPARSPPGDVCAGRRRRQVGAHCHCLSVISAFGFPPSETLKAFFKVKTARARYGFWKPYGYWSAVVLLQVKPRWTCR